MHPNVAPSEQPRSGLFRTAILVALLAFGVLFSGAGGLSLGHLFGASAAPAAVQQSTPPAAPTSISASAGVSGLSVADVAAKGNPATVTITVLQAGGGFFGSGSSDEVQPAGVGSGVIIDDEGHILTNWHVIAGATEIEVQFFDGTTAPAEVVGGDQFQDVAIVKLNLTNGVTVPAVATLGDSDTVRAGDPVVAIGSALGEFTNTVTDGIIGAVDRSLENGSYRLPNLLQHDAPISPGNSGGPLFNLAGEVIGINVAKVDGAMMGGPQASGLGFAITINAAKELATQIIDTGRALRPYLGIQSEPFGGGQVVAEVEPGTPAAEAGLQVGDVITAINDDAVDSRNPLINLLFEHQPGERVTLTIDRDGTTEQVDVVLAERPADTQ